MPKKEEVKVAWDCKGNRKLEMFLQCPADEILYGGAAGGAKSEGLLIAAIGHEDVGVFNCPNWKVLILRRTFPELERSLILRSQQLFTGRGNYDAVKHRWRFPQGGSIEFGHIKNEADKYKYQSAEYSMIEFDELTHFTESIYTYLFSRLRSTDPRIKCKIKAATNPGGIGHAWVKKRFLGDVDAPRTPYELYYNNLEVPGVGMTKWSQCFIPATVFDNRFLVQADPMYVRRLMELPEVERRALLEGDWNIFSGQFFPEWSEDHVTDGFNIPEGWPVWISMDWGTQTKCAVLFFTQDPTTETVICFDEIYVSKMNADKVSGLIKERLGDHFVDLVGLYTDKRVLVKDDDNNVSTREKFAFNGLHFRIADTDRVNGWHRVRELLERNQDGSMRFKVFKRCSNLIRTLPEMIFDINTANHEGKAEDMEKRAEAHCVDALRYFAISRRHTDSMRNDAPVHMDFSPRTGYLGMDRAEPLLRSQIKRLTNAKKGVNYFFHSKSNEEVE